MLITTLVALGGTLFFLAMMAYTAIVDLRTRRIPNWVVLTLAVAFGPLAWFSGHELIDMIVSMGAAVLVFALGLFCFSRGWLGGGDVKLASVCVLWLGAPLAPAFLLLATLIGAVFTLAGLIGMRMLARAGHEVEWGVDGRVPYGPGIACAALLVLQVSPWVTVLS